MTRVGNTTYTWEYTDADGNIQTLPDGATRYVINNGARVSYTGTRYVRSGNGTNVWDYTYEPITEPRENGLYGVDSRDAHVALIRVATDTYTYSYDSDGDDEADTPYTGVRYYVQSNNPVTYTGTRYTKDDGVYHVTDADAVTGLYGKDGNNAWRALTATVTHPQLWGYYTTEDGETVWHEYGGTRYTRSTNQQNSWQLYKQFVGVYGATFEQYNYSWPMEYNWYETGYGTGGNATATYYYPAGTAGGTRMTYKSTFEPMDENLDQKYYGGTATTSGKYIIFETEELDGNYIERDRVYLGSNAGGFNINDKYTGFHAYQYRADNGQWRDVGTKNPTTGIYGSAVSYNNYLTIRFARNNYDLVFFNDLDDRSNLTTLSVPYGASLADYADRDPGQKSGHYFLGWYTDDAHVNHFDFSGTMPDHNVSVFGYWRIIRVRMIFIPGADNVYVDPGQALSFRVNSDEVVDGGLLESVTRPGYIFDGWYIDPEFMRPFLFSSPINSETEGVDMTYQTAARWASTRAQYGDNVEKYENVRGVLRLYARWIINTAQKGVTVTYNAGIANTLTTTVPVDPVLYQDGSDVIVGAAPSDYSELYVFQGWQAIGPDGSVQTITDSNGNQVSLLPPGTSFNVDNVAANSETTDPDTGEVLLKNILLRAYYERVEEIAQRYTFITYDGSSLTDSVYPSGTEVLQGKARDGSERYTVTLDQEINHTIVLPNEESFYLDGYTLAGWSFFTRDEATEHDGSYEDQIAQAQAWKAAIEAQIAAVNSDSTLTDEEKETRVAELQDMMLPVMLAIGDEVAADNFNQSEVNGDENTLYAMWLPKTYTVTVKQVIEDGVPVNAFTYTYKSGVENALGSVSNRTETLTGSTSVTYEYLSGQTQTEANKFQYYDRVGHVFHIVTPTIAENLDYAVRVSATVLRDDGTRETLPLNGYDNYEILGHVTITYTYALKVPVTLEKRALDTDGTLTGSKFLLTPVAWNSETQRWDVVGTTTFEYDLTSSASATKRLQEGVYRINETKAPVNYADMSEPLLLTVRKGEAFLLRNTSGNAVSENIAKLTGTVGTETGANQYKLVIYDRPIREVVVKKLVNGTDLTADGKYTFSVQLTLEGSPMRSYDTVGDGQPADTTSSAGIIQFTLANEKTKTLRIPWGAVVTVTENEYAQFTVSAAAVETADETLTIANTFAGANPNNRVFRFTLDKNATVTYTNSNKLLTVTKAVTGPWGERNRDFDFTVTGLKPSAMYYYTLAGASKQAATSPAGELSFRLKHGETMVLPLPVDAVVTVTEAQAEHYTTSVVVGTGDSTEALTADVTLADDVTIAFTNYRPAVAPTGVRVRMLPFAVMLILGCGLGLAGRRRREEVDSL